MVIKIRPRGEPQEAIVYANPQAQKDAEAAETAALKADLTTFLQELGRYTIWVLSITMITMVTRSSVSLHFTNEVVKSSIDGALASVPSGNIVTIWQALSLISEIVLTSEFLFKDKSFASVYRKTYDTFGNIRIGDISLRQVRVKPSTCPTLVIDGVPSSCSPDFSYFDEANFFTKPWDSKWSVPTQRASEFEYKSAQQTQEWFAFSGKNAFYPGSGFVAKFANLNDAAEVLAHLKSHEWIDALTRAVFFDAVSYNPNSDFFIQTKILFEIYPSGQFESTIYSRVIDLNFYPSSPSLLDVVNIGLQGIVLILLGYYTKEEATAIFKEGPRAYFSQIWNTFDVANIFLLFTLCIIRIILISESSVILQNLPEASPSKLGSIMILAETECILMGVISVLMWFKMLKYFSMHKPLGKLGRAVSTVIEDILANSVVIVCCMFGWAIGQTLVSGMDMQRFSTITISMTAHFCSLFGGYFGDTYPDLSEKSQSGTLMFWTWYLFSQLILLNIFVVIFEYGLVLTMQEDARNKKRTMFSVVKELDVVKKVMTVIQSQEEALAQMESGLEIVDEDDDGLIDEEELKSFLSSNKDATAIFDVQDEKEMMKMFDQDGSGKLDADEMGDYFKSAAARLLHISLFQQANCVNFWGKRREKVSKIWANRDP